MLAARPTRRVLAILLSLAFTLAGLELGSRCLDLVRGKPWCVDDLHAQIETECRALSRRAFLPGAAKDDDNAAQSGGTMLLQPYTGWEQLQTHALIVDDIRYYQSEQARETYDVCILGGSVAETFGELGAAHLVELLRRDPRLASRAVRVHDFGFGAYKQPQPTMLFTYLLLLGHAPDAVIVLDGFNESALGFSNAAKGGHPVYPYLAGWANATKGLRPDWELGERMHEVHAAHERAESFATRVRDSGLWHSSFLAHVGLARIRSLRRDYAEAYKRLEKLLQTGATQGESAGPPFDASEPALIEQLVRAWSECSRTMRATCAERGIDYLHVLQPTLHDEGSKPLTETETKNAGSETEWIRGVHLVYPRLREAGRELAARGIAFFDATQVFRDHPEDVYIDVCHFREHGNEILAEAVAQAFLEKALRR